MRARHSLPGRNPWRYLPPVCGGRGEIPIEPRPAGFWVDGGSAKGFSVFPRPVVCEFLNILY